MTLRPVTLILTAIAMSAASAAPAQTSQPASSVITMVRTGWGMDSFAVVTTGSFVNPAGCQIHDGYISEKSQPGYQTYYSAALAAITSHLRVVVTVHNTLCFNGRPVIIGINLIP